jgi:WD40 repeat protein
MEDSTIRIWNYMTGQCELAREYYVLEDKSVRNQAKPLITIAMHPSGYQLAASFIDKIKIYQILHDGLQELRSIEIRNSPLIKYSRGGQYFFAVNKQFISIFNAYTFVELDKIHIDTNKVLSIAFADLDRAFAVLGQKGYIGKWKLPSFEKITSSKPDRLSNWSDYRDIDFVKDPRDAPPPTS